MSSFATFLSARDTPSPIDPETIHVPLTYEPDPADLALSSVPGQEMFDPRKRKFTADELKPQPMIKKARKVFIPEDLKVREREDLGFGWGSMGGKKPIIIVNFIGMKLSGHFPLRQFSPFGDWLKSVSTGWQVLGTAQKEQRCCKAVTGRSQAEGEPDCHSRLFPGERERGAAFGGGGLEEGAWPLQKRYGKIRGPTWAPVRSTPSSCPYTHTAQIPHTW